MLFPAVPVSVLLHNVIKVHFCLCFLRSKELLPVEELAILIIASFVSENGFIFSSLCIKGKGWNRTIFSICKKSKGLKTRCAI